jgi:hypothetical protein
MRVAEVQEVNGRTWCATVTEVSKRGSVTQGSCGRGYMRVKGCRRGIKGIWKGYYRRQCRT